MKKISKINLVDRYLLGIMFVLFFYTFTTVIIQAPLTDFSTNLDIVVRTTIASIFGYFISSNFASGSHTTVEKKEEQHSTNTSTQTSTAIDLPVQVLPEPTAVNQIGFTAVRAEDSDSQTQTLGHAENLLILPQDEKPKPSNNLQINIIGVLCLLSIIFLLSTRYIGMTQQTDVATLSQYRDIICGSIGFLIGMPNSSSDK